MPSSPSLSEWEAAGRTVRLCGIDIFVVDRPPSGQARAEPLLLLHGFPTSSYDFRHLVAPLGEERRIVALDFPGFGLSAKPDRRYSIELYADVVAAACEEVRLERAALLSHDMGDTVGGELLARQGEGRWPVEVTRRVLTNGSIYLDLAHLTEGQQLLLALPDASIGEGPDRASLADGLAATMAGASREGREAIALDAELVCRGGGNRLLPRTIRYIEDRRRDERRYTGAIEAHPSELTVAWGTEDPVAVAAMVDRLRDRRPSARAQLLHGVGHYPMLEAPEAFLEAVREGLG